MKKKVVGIVLFVGLSASLVQGKEDPVLPPPWIEKLEDKEFRNAAIQMDGDRFEAYASEQLEEAQEKKSVPVDLIAAMLHRLEHGSYVPPQKIGWTVARVENRVDGNPAYSENMNRADVKTQWTIQFLKAAIGKCRFQPLVKFAFADRLCQILSCNGEFEKHIPICTKLVQEMENVQLDMMDMIQKNRIDVAAHMLFMKRHDEADAIYLQVISFPWFQVPGGEKIQRFRDLYLRGMVGLIGARRGELKKLKEIVISPSCNAKLQPVLDAAIAHAKANPKNTP